MTILFLKLRNLNEIRTEIQSLRLQILRQFVAVNLRNTLSFLTVSSEGQTSKVRNKPVTAKSTALSTLSKCAPKQFKSCALKLGNG